MTFEIFVSSAVVSTVFGFIGNIIAAKIAQKTAIKEAQEAAIQEIKKMERVWEREDIISSDAEFSEMIRMSILFALRTNIGQPDVLANIGAVRAKECGELAGALDDLYRAVKGYAYEDADRCVDRAIELKRKLRE